MICGYFCLENVVSVYLKEEVVGSTKFLITVAFSSPFEPPAGVYFLGSCSVVLWDGDVSWVCFRICLPPAGEVFLPAGNSLVLLIGFHILLNCNGSKCEEKQRLSSCLLRMERNKINIFAW